MYLPQIRKCLSFICNQWWDSDAPLEDKWVSLIFITFDPVEFFNLLFLASSSPGTYTSSTTIRYRSSRYSDRFRQFEDYVSFVPNLIAITTAATSRWFMGSIRNSRRNVLRNHHTHICRLLATSGNALESNRKRSSTGTRLPHVMRCSYKQKISTKRFSYGSRKFHMDPRMFVIHTFLQR